MTNDAFVDLVRSRLEVLLDRVASDHGEPAGREGLLVALSGGPDSVALLHAAIPWAEVHGSPLVAAHYDHRLRGTSSQRDQAFCTDLCRTLDVPLVAGGGDVRGAARQRGRGVEEAARALRHSFLESVRVDRSLTAVATGHHRDDQAETVVQRVFRGTGLDGLRGIRPVAGRIIHPLLETSRRQILDYLDARSLTWRDDPSNDDASNTRGRIRRELLPLVRDIFGEGADAAPARLANLVETDLDHLDELAERAWRHCAIDAPAGMTPPAVDVETVVALPVAIARRVIRRWLRDLVPLDLAAAHVDDVRRWLGRSSSGTGIDLPGPLRLVRVFGAAGIAETPPPSDTVTDWRVTVEPLAAVPDPVPPPELTDGVWRLVCSGDRLRGSLRLRHPISGDRLEPFGLDGSKKLSDLVQEQRIPSTMRPSLILVEDDGGPLWVLGVAQDERTRLLPSTRTAVTICVARRRPDGRG